uniref:F-box domain-containing protein n=1 Tax=Kalanchoe fedtschenkoi TaxID=63787 RepID=A0A7N0SVL3_KALFE
MISALFSINTTNRNRPARQHKTLARERGENFPIANRSMETTELSHLPEGCVAHIVSLTTPRDACRFTNVSALFRSAADSDAVWDAFLPPDLHAIVARSDAETQKQLAAVHPRKQLFMRLADSPILIDGGHKSFFLEKSSGKKCFMISAREMTIVWGDTPTYWKWTSLPESRFAEVAKLRNVCWLEMSARIETSLLSSKTTYTSHLVFKLKANSNGFDNIPVETSVGINGGVKDSKRIFLAPYDRLLQIVPRPMRFSSFGRRLRRARPAAEETAEGSSSGGARDAHLYPKHRADGWMEAELGECFLDGDDGGELEVSVKEVERGHWKRGLVIQGIEFRPKA